ncbi:unnamed protein product [Parascedosporium putredinis]|uniref:Uncharacterized protein n=1 Tax=Parascedosporium putredinis TaxID=1442378 RepID=A0A9P1H4M8_9PEZI|nr:unnamed protein product [Parascedosporium putredinis]CAI7998420.1 unnamed protein product [Parascedosporium putredinis]
MASDAASISSQSTEASFVKPALPAADATSADKAERRRLRTRLRTALSDMGTPPTSRHDKEHGIETPKHVDLGMVRASTLSRT